MVTLRDAIIYNSSDMVSKALSKINKTDRPVIVTKRGKYYGLIDSRTVKQHHSLDFSKTLCSSVSVNTPKLTQQSSLLDLCNAFFSSRFKVLPVVDDKNKVEGVIWLTDVLKELLDQNVIPDKKSSEVMTVPIITLNENETVSRAIMNMRKYSVRRLIITNDKEKVVGILSAKDLSMISNKPNDRSPSPFYKGKFSYDSQPIKPLVNRAVISVTPATNIKLALKTMLKNNVSSLVLIDKRVPYGLLSTRDLLETVLSVSATPNVQVSGLESYDKQYKDEVYELSVNTANKLSKRFDFQTLTIHVKKHGHRYTTRVRAIIAGKIISVHHYDWGLISSVLETLKELETTILRMKPADKNKLKKKLRKAK